MAAKKSDTVTVKWNGTAGIEQAHRLRDELLEAMNKGSHILLNIEEVEDIDITGIQIIIAARKEAEIQNKTFYITGKIPEVVTGFTAACRISLEEYALPGNEEN